MDIERLNKSQIVLLTLLTSFVTSIATGIVTVSLMEKAPPAITQTINRVVERTVEKVVPAETQPAAAATVVTKEKTVTIRESDLVADAIAKVRPSVVRVHTTNAGDTATFIARGVYVAEDIVVAPATGMTVGATYVVIGAEASYDAKVAGINAGLNVALLVVEKGSRFTPASFSKGSVVLGQTVVGISGATGIKIAQGIVTGVSGEGELQTSFDTSMEDLVPGTSLIDTKGGVIGMTAGKNSVVTTSQLLEFVQSFTIPEDASPSSDAS
jgi:hypothetical protein